MMIGDILLGIGALILGVVSVYKIQNGEVDGIFGISVALFFIFLAFLFGVV